MIELGSVNLSCDESIISIRNKVIEISYALGLSEMYATRMGTLISETCHRCLNKESLMSVTFFYIDKKIKHGIHIRLSPINCQVDLKFLESFIDELRYSKDDESFCSLGATIFFKHVEKRMTPSVINNIKEIINNRTRQELLEIISRQNKDLKETKKELAEKNKLLREEVILASYEVQKTQEAALDSIATLAEYRDMETGGHIERCKHFVKRLAQALYLSSCYKDSLSEEIIHMYSRSAAMHDIGKIGISDSILLKHGRLTDEEFEIMKEHTRLGYQVLHTSSKKLGENTFLDFAKELALSHHERWDGYGYPQGLFGQAIPLSARIMSLVDVYDALRSKRVYKEAFSHEKTLDIIVKGSGNQFDPVIVETFLSIHHEFEKLYDEIL